MAEDEIDGTAPPARDELPICTDNLRFFAGRGRTFTLGVTSNF